MGQEEVTEGRESDSDAEVLCVDRKRAMAGGVGMMAPRSWVTYMGFAVARAEEWKP